MRLSLKPYDIFISYVVEDREIVELLYKELTSKGLKVWYANRELYPGAEIRSVINRGLNQSRYGIAVITPSYNSLWAFGELFYLMRENDTLIPVLHQISLEEVTIAQPELATRFCLNTTSGVETTAREIANYVRGTSPITSFVSKVATWLTPKLLMLVFSVLGSLALIISLFAFYYLSIAAPDASLLNEQIDKRIEQIDKTIHNEIQQDIVQSDASASSLDEVLQAETAFVENTHYYRNKLDFFNGVDHIKTAVGLRENGVFSPEQNIVAPFGLTKYSIYLFKEKQNIGLGYALINLLPLYHEIGESRRNGNYYEVDVHYSNYLQYIVVNVSVDSAESRRINKVNLFGTKPRETFVFEKTDDDWILSTIR